MQFSTVTGPFAKSPTCSPFSFSSTALAPSGTVSAAVNPELLYFVFSV